MKRHPERSEGCTACAWQDKVKGTFLNSLGLNSHFLKKRIYLKFDTIKVYVNHKKLKLELCINIDILSRGEYA